MPTITLSGSAPKVVVVNRSNNVATVTARASAVQVPSNTPEVGSVREQTKVLAVASTGVQGRPGVPTNFDDDLLALYNIAKL